MVLHRRFGEFEQRQIALVLLPCIISAARRPDVRSIPGRGRWLWRGRVRRAEDLGRDIDAAENTRFSALVITSRPADFGMKPTAP